MINVHIFDKGLYCKKNGHKLVIDYEILVDLLKAANRRFDQELQEFTESIVDIESGHIAWIATWRSIRLDDLEGLQLYYFLCEVMESLCEEYPKEQVVIEGSFPKSVEQYFKHQFGSENVINKISLFEKIKNYFSPFKLLQSLIKKSDTHENDVKNGYWFSTPKDTRKHRYKCLLTKLGISKKIFFYGNHIESVKHVGDCLSIDFSTFSKWADLYTCIKKAKKLKNDLNKESGISLIAVYIQNQPLIHLAGMILKEMWIKRAIVTLQPKGIFFTTANNYAPARLISRLAYRYDVPFYIVACRPMLLETRAEERLIEADIQKTHQAHVCDAYIVWDQYSKETLQKYGFPEPDIYIASCSDEDSNNDKIVQKKLTILFTHEKKLNDLLINELSGLDQSFEWCIREHPLCKLTEGQKQILEDEVGTFEVLTDVPFNQLKFIESFVITINSSAAIEACGQGAGILWLPYLNFRSLIYDPVFKTIGTAARSRNEFIHLMKDIESFERRRELIQTDQQSYNENFQAINEIPKFNSERLSYD